MNTGDTIVALSTPPGRGALSIIRVSGPGVPELAGHFFTTLPIPRRACLRELRDAQGRTLDQGVLTFYPAPASATGEDVLEISCHGAPAVVRALLQQLQEWGARMADPGEFSRRAFEAGKLDLNQAQAIADLIAATSERAARCAARVLKGDISKEIHTVLQEIIEVRVYVEGALDFPDEDVDWLAESDVGSRLEVLYRRIDALTQRARQGRVVSAGLSLALLGPPNVGKSSLLNHFTGDETAIVTAHPGTTRDMLVAPIQINGISVRLMDTAGIRQARDEAEEEGVRRSWKAAEEADLLLQVFDADAGWSDADVEIAARLPVSRPTLTLANKCDLLGDGVLESGPEDACRLSAKTGDGIAELCQRIEEILNLDGAMEEDEFMASQRQLNALTEVHAAMQRACTVREGELIAEEMRVAQKALARITGEFSSDDLLGEIFGRFCIGK